ncbi:MAG: DUF1080 domain-containing protein [Gemmatimonadota bacterium]|nr:MAG: DUF1080 domain-containing protein [Gemmatimonadota bacterium]
MESNRSKMEKIPVNYCLFILFANTLAFHANTQGRAYSFTDDELIVYDAENETIPLDTTVHEGKKSLRLKQNEIALLKDSDYDDFRLEVDMMGAGMAGIGFRSMDLFNYEFIYVRTESSGTENSIQYVPLYNGATSWQLYNAPEYETNASFNGNEWFHVTLIVQGDNLRLFINNSEDPRIEVELLRSDLSRGQILLKSEFDPVYYANVEIQELEARQSVSEPKEPADTHLTDWLISEPFPLNEGWLFWDTGSFLQSFEGWNQIAADRDGVINLSKYVSHPINAVAAKTVLTSESAVRRQLLFDYTHTLIIVLNSEILFYGKEMDDYGYVHDGEETIVLPLQQGENELLFLINGDAELYGEGVRYQGRTQCANWGYVAKLDNYDGITIMAR